MFTNEHDLPFKTITIVNIREKGFRIMNHENGKKNSGANNKTPFAIFWCYGLS